MNKILTGKRNEKAVSLTVLNGFQGSGKTTLLNRILSEGHGLRIAVIVNNLLSLSIDASQIISSDSRKISLLNGCICYHLQGDLMEAVNDTMSDSPTLEYIILEAGGMTEPGGITVSFSDPEIRERIRLDGIVCVLDAEKILEKKEEVTHKLWQVAFSDLLILNKMDMVDEDQAAEIKKWLDENFNKYRLFETSFSQVPLELLIGRQGAGVDEKKNAPARRKFETWFYENKRPFSLEILRNVAGRLPAEFYRCKGIIYSVESMDRMFILRVTGKRVDLVKGPAWGTMERKTNIEAIGTTLPLNQVLLEIEFDKCITKDPLNFRNT